MNDRNVFFKTFHGLYLALSLCINANGAIAQNLALSTSVMNVDYENRYYSLEAFVSGQAASNGNLNVVERGLVLMLSQRIERIEKLSLLVAQHGIKLDYTDRSLLQLTQFYCSNISKQEGTNHIAFFWGEVSLDIAVYIGEIAIQRYPSLRWDILERHDTEHPYFHEIGLKNGNLDLPIFKSIILFGNNVVTGNVAFQKLMDDQFSRMIKDYGTMLARYE